jgi:hypothetical protein
MAGGWILWLALLQPRAPRTDADLRDWLVNMVAYHRFTVDEVAAATSLTPAQIEDALRRFGIKPRVRPAREPGAPLVVLPYPGGRHPRIGFRDGAIDPQRETKISVFTPWDPDSYVVVDVPEAIWSNLGLTYLAHTHVPTIWTQRRIELRTMEWERRPDGTLTIGRRLPNGIEFGATILPAADAVRMELWLRNGTSRPLSDLRVQNCAMLARAAGFARQTNDNKVLRDGYAACRSDDGRRWVITGWEPIHRAWANAPCPCLHADPKFPDCEPGRTQRLRGLLWFYEGTDIDGELKRMEATGWRRAVRLSGRIRDADTGEPVAARIYVRGEDGTWHFPRSRGGTAVEYRRQTRLPPESTEMHTTLSAHPFDVDLPPGRATVTVERGKEYRTATRQITMGSEPVETVLSIERWVDMARAGWYSGDTHVHRSLDELPNVVLAEDLNVALPLTSWVRDAFVAPKADADAPRLIAVDRTHVIYPRNTEYEIFTVRGKNHTLGAFFVLNHKSVFPDGVPPIAPVLRRARAEGALIDLDKHNWPWSMAIVPILKVDLFELANNHMWRAPIAYGGWGEMPPPYMNAELDKAGALTERGWLDATIKHYYALLNCGQRLRPTGGTASGVHPVPLGFGRVYVHLPDGFSYEAWMDGLNRGRSFVTTGPMLPVSLDGFDPGRTFTRPGTYHLRGNALADTSIDRVEIVINGRIARTIRGGRPEVRIDEEIPIESSSWVAVRCFEARPDGRIRFAHTGPWHIDVEGRPLRPPRDEVEYLIRRVEEEIARSRDLIPPEALAEYESALRVYRAAAER